MEKGRNVTWQQMAVSRYARELAQGHRSGVVWFTGLSGAGKSTLANALELELSRRGIRTYLLDGDNVRHGLNQDLGFTISDRQENIRRVGHLAKLFVDAGVVVITAMISPLRADRRMARELFANDEFVEVFVDCPLDVCIARDPKGLYQKAQSGLITDFTGISSPYERPEFPEITIPTDTMSVEQAVAKMRADLLQRIEIRHEVDCKQA